MAPSRAGMLLRVLAAALALATAAAHCPNMCNGHGRCVAVNRCECFTGWAGGDCSQRKCPTGAAWSDIATGVDSAHQDVECSNRGVCNYGSGRCECYLGFEGIACQRMSCPSTGCGDHGVCTTMRSLASTLDTGTLEVSSPYTNVRASYPYSAPWDADGIQGCACDAGFKGWDCGARRCPLGDDPLTTGQEDEVQLLRCDLDPADPAFQGPQFTLSFRGAVTRPFAADIDASLLRSLLQELPTIGEVGVSFSSGGTTLCDATYASASSDPITQPASGNVAAITFLTEFGDLPRLTVLDAGAKPLWGPRDNLFLVAAKGESLLATTALAPTLETATFTSTTGTKESEPCSRRGRCDEATGVCGCYTGFTASDARGRQGVRPDCGYPYLPITSCPGSGGVECSGHGVCSGHPAYSCACHTGWTGGDCGQRLCPLGKAWFDYPSAADTAHAPTECSNKGSCNRRSGLCECEEGFEGEACERMSCPGKGTAAGVCSGHGQCLTMFELAAFADVNGDPEPVTYGQDPANPLTWDARSVRGCRCDEGWMGPDCSQRTCPWGNDATLLESDMSRLDEQQALICTLLASPPFAPGSEPTFTLSFRGDSTLPLRYDATAAEVADALAALPSSLGKVAVAFIPLTATPLVDAVCTDPSALQRIVFTFATAHGDVPPLRVAMDAATVDPLTGAAAYGLGFLPSQLQFTGGDPAAGYGGYPLPAAWPEYAFIRGGGGYYAVGGIRAREIRKGTSGWAECSGRGICDRTTGLCQCFLGFAASDNQRKLGDLENCGAREPLQWAQAQFQARLRGGGDAAAAAAHGSGAHHSSGGHPGGSRGH